MLRLFLIIFTIFIIALIIGVIRFFENTSEINKIPKKNSDIRNKDRTLINEILNREIITLFFEICYRKVKILDEYGDEQWDQFDKEFEKLIVKLKMTNISLSLKQELKESLLLRFEKYIVDQKSIDKIEFSKLSGIDFEIYLMNLLKQTNFKKVSGTKQSGDQGADILFEYGEIKGIIQAKRWAGKVGNKAIQETLSAKLFYERDIGFVITSSSFSKSARELALKLGIVLIEGSEIGKIEQIIKSSMSNTELKKI